MIVREVLRNQTLLDNFDWFNDGDDTIRWLQGFEGEINAKAAIIAAEMVERRDAYWESRRATTKTDNQSNKWPDWISVKGLIPAANGKVLVFDEVEGVDTAMFRRNVDGYPVFDYDELYTCDYVTHWMPLPDRPNAESATSSKREDDFVSRFKSVSDDERLRMLSELACCTHCGSLNPNCQCWNDE